MTRVVFATWRCPRCHHQRLERNDAITVAHRCKPADRHTTPLHKITNPQQEEHPQ